MIRKRNEKFNKERNYRKNHTKIMELKNTMNENKNAREQLSRMDQIILKNLLIT